MGSHLSARTEGTFVARALSLEEAAMMEWMTSPEAWIALGALTLLEIVLGIDNIVFISILSNKLPEDQQQLARRVGSGWP